MPRSLRIVFIFGLFLLVLIAIVEIPKTISYSGRDFISGSVDHLIIVITAVLVGAILLWIVEESIEHHIAPAINMGLKNMAVEVAGEVRKFPQSFKKLSEASEEENASIKTPEVKDLVSKGKLDEAVQQSKSSEEQIAVLLKSQDSDDWRKAIQVARENLPNVFKYFMLIPYLFWQSGDLDEAIRLSEEGLQSAQKAKSMVDILKIQNCLAYYYADSKKGEYEKRAREYATSARNSLPDIPETLDTEGFVKITFGRTREEVLEGVALCDQAKNLGSPFQGYAKAIARAQEKLNELRNQPAIG
jgi:hypothetical protein